MIHPSPAFWQGTVRLQSGPLLLPLLLLLLLLPSPVCRCPELLAARAVSS